MIASDEEVRKAAERVGRYISGSESLDRIYGDIHPDELGVYQADRQMLVEWSIDDLARRDQEAAERALPIDEEWLASIGWEFRGVFWYYSLPNKRQLVMSQTFSESDVLIKNVASPQFVGLGKMQNRGQLIDLLAALKGGAS